MLYNDEWADTTKSGVQARSAVSITYSSLATPAPTNGIINYPDHIQPLWTLNRGANTCTNCHNASDTKLDLSASYAGTGRLESYEKLLVGEPLLDANGRPVTRIEEGVLHCPCHEGYFDLKTGRNIAGPPPRPLPKIALSVEGDDIYAIGVDERTV